MLEKWLPPGLDSPRDIEDAIERLGTPFVNKTYTRESRHTPTHKREHAGAKSIILILVFLTHTLQYYTERWLPILYWLLLLVVLCLSFNVGRMGGFSRSPRHLHCW